MHGKQIVDVSCFGVAGLNRLIDKLDRRHNKKSQLRKTPSFKALPRVIRSPLKAKHPASAPQWAIKKSCWSSLDSSDASHSTSVEPLSSTPVSSTSASTSGIQSELPSILLLPVTRTGDKERELSDQDSMFTIDSEFDEDY